MLQGFALLSVVGPNLHRHGSTRIWSNVNGNEPNVCALLPAENTRLLDRSEIDDLSGCRGYWKAERACFIDRLDQSRKIRDRMEIKETTTPNSSGAHKERSAQMVRHGGDVLAEFETCVVPIKIGEVILLLEVKDGLLMSPR